MKRVSFNIAKMLKEIDYPQKGSWYYSPDGKIGEVVPNDVDFAAPTYLNVWLWLWREKEIQIELQYDKHESNAWCEIADDEYKEFDNKDPEEAIIAAIEYLVDNNLIK